MDFKFIHFKLIEDNLLLNKRFNYFLFYSGYDLHKFTSDFLDYINAKDKTIFLLNIDESISEKITREGKHKIISTETTKRHNLYLEGNGVFSISSKVLLLDLITEKLSCDLVDYIIIGDSKLIEDDSKEIYISKFLASKSQKAKFYFLHNSPIEFPSFYDRFRQNLNSVEFSSSFKIHFLSRHHQLIDKTIEYGLNIKQVQIYEYNINDIEIKQIKDFLTKIYFSCLEEIRRLTLSQIKDEIQSQVENCLQILDINTTNSSLFYNTINTLTNNNLFPFKARVLLKDLFAIKGLIRKLDYLDFPSLLSLFNKFLRESDENSFFNYKDIGTQTLFDTFTEMVKQKIYSLKKNENSQEITKTIYLEKLLELSDKNCNILQNYSLLLTNQQLKTKTRKLLEILDLIKTNNTSQENILITTTYNTDNLKEVLSSYYIIKDNGQSFFEKKIKHYLASKSEYSKRQRIINQHSHNSYTSNMFIENLLLQKLCIDLFTKYDFQNEQIFEKYLQSLNEKNDNLPSEIELSETIFKQLDPTHYENSNIIPPHNVHIEHFDSKLDCLKLKEYIIKEKISIVILHQYEIELMRYLESLICNYDECYIKEIHIINQTDSNCFLKEIYKIRDESLFFESLQNKLKTMIETSTSISSISKSKSNIFHVESDKKKNILIDFREMSSKLPFYLYDFGFNIVVGSLESGDYITSNSVCIERKSMTTGDLVDSLRSGRLINQIVKMQKYFEFIIILLEYEDDMQVDLSANNKIFKQKYLYKKFIELKNMSNKIHFIWSKNPKMTSVLLNILKNKFPDYLDVQKCLNLNKRDPTAALAMNTKTKRSSNQITNDKQSISSQKSITSFFKDNTNNTESNHYII